MTDDPDTPSVLARRRGLLAFAAAAAVVWAGVGGYAVWWKFYGEWDKAEHLAGRAQAGQVLTEAEFDWALARVGHAHAAVARHARTAAAGGSRGPERLARLVAAAEPLLADPAAYRRLEGVQLLVPALVRTPADPLRAAVLAAAVALLDEPNPHLRAMAVQYVGFLGTAAHLPKVAAVRDAATDPLEKRLAGEAADRLAGKP